MPLKLSEAEKERIRLEIRRQAPEVPELETPQFQPQPSLRQPEPSIQPPAFAIPREQPIDLTPRIKQEQLPATPAVIKKPKERVSVPIWQRALQVFGAPFDWVDENIIKPGLGIAGTALGIPEVERKAGEDFFEWKKRSWAALETPGIDIKVPWQDKPLRLDVKGVLELAPWLLIPGAGQVGTAARAARGLAGVLGKFGKAGRVLGRAVEFSPWGLVEKVAGRAIGVAGRTVGRRIDVAHTRLGERIAGKLPEPPPPTPEIQALTKAFKEQVIPAREAFEAALPQLRATQRSAIRRIIDKRNAGEITDAVADKQIDKATGGAIKQLFAIEVPKVKGKAVPEVVAPSAIEIRNWRAMGLTNKDIAELRTMVPRLRELRTHQARIAGFRNVSDEAIDDYLQKSLKYAEELNDEKAIRTLRKAIDFNKRGELQDAILESEKGLGYIHQSSGELQEHIAELGRLGGASKSAEEVLGLTFKGKVAPEVTEKAGQVFSKAHTKSLKNTIWRAEEDEFAIRTARQAFDDLNLHGTIPEPAVIRIFQRVFGKDFADVVSSMRGVPPSRMEKIVDLLNLPRAVLASTDLSASGRQGLILSLMHPTRAAGWFGKQLKAFYSERLTLEMDDALRARPSFKQFTSKTGGTSGYIAPVREGAALSSKEETFISTFARKIPFVRRSERAFITYLNEARLGSFEAASGTWLSQGASEAEMGILKSFINLASGRGELPANLNRYAPMLNAVLFSPRLQAATLQLPRQIGRMLLSRNPYMRKEAARALVTFVGGGTALVGLLDATGVSDKVEVDPRSGDFGKIKIGETRLDIWRGYLQYIRFAAQLLTSERKSAYGNMNKAERSEIAWRFLQSKSSPALGLLVDLMKGENYLGEPLFEKTTGAIKTARNRFMPLAIQDVIDAMEQSGTQAAWVAAPAVLGIGSLTIVNDLVRVKEKIARDAGFDSWDDIDPKTQREIEQRNTELQIAQIEFDRQVMGTAWGDWRGAGNAIEDVFKENVALATTQYQATGDGVQYREKVKEAFLQRRGGYKARDKEERFSDIVERRDIEDTLESMVALGPEQQAIKIYNDALFGDDMYDQFGDYMFDEAILRKEQVKLRLDAMEPGLFDYVEEYRGMKFDDFPIEFQELQAAKIILRPYWSVGDWYIENILKGRKPRVGSPSERMFDRFVGRQRKRMRRTDPEIEAAYQRFYVR